MAFLKFKPEKRKCAKASTGISFIISDMKTRFITGRARSDFVPINTRLACREQHLQQQQRGGGGSGGQGKKLLKPSITKTDATVRRRAKGFAYSGRKGVTCGGLCGMPDGNIITCCMGGIFRFLYRAGLVRLGNNNPSHPTCNFPFQESQSRE